MWLYAHAHTQREKHFPCALSATTKYVCVCVCSCVCVCVCMRFQVWYKHVLSVQQHTVVVSDQLSSFLSIFVLLLRFNFKTSAPPCARWRPTELTCITTHSAIVTCVCSRYVPQQSDVHATETAAPYVGWLPWVRAQLSNSYKDKTWPLLPPSRLNIPSVFSICSSSGHESHLIQNNPMRLCNVK